MTKNHSDKKIEDRGEILLDTTNQYIKNERSKNESENILNIVGEKLKSRIKAFTKRRVNRGTNSRRNILLFYF